ncbi:hypothetical protein [Stutzerimonas chloritidismutans]
MAILLDAEAAVSEVVAQARLPRLTPVVQGKLTARVRMLNAEGWTRERR